MPEDSIEHIDFDTLHTRAISQPLITHMYTADPAAHVFDGKLYIYPSHDRDAGIPFNDNGDHFDMEDYHVISMDSIDSTPIDHGMALHISSVPWAKRQMWDSDVQYKNGTYYLYFSAKRPDGIFQIGVATSKNPAGPFTAEPQPISGSYSIDPCAFCDIDGAYYLYFGGIWGGQLQKYRNNTYSNSYELLCIHEPALGPRVAKLSKNMLEFAEAPREIDILDAQGNKLVEGDISRRFFEASWMHMYKGIYYFTYSTGDGHTICYATGSSPYGPFTYRGVVLHPVVGWTTHHSICEFNGSWYLFYHDSSLSKGVTHLRSMKVTKLTYAADGSIKPIFPYGTDYVL